MEENSKIKVRRNYRVTIIYKDEVIREKFETQEGAKKTVTSMRDLFPDTFISGCVEKKQKRWKVIWIADTKKS